jgi:hypothetical protein
MELSIPGDGRSPSPDGAVEYPRFDSQQNELNQFSILKWIRNEGKITEGKKTRWCSRWMFGASRGTKENNQ